MPSASGIGGVHHHLQPSANLSGREINSPSRRFSKIPEMKPPARHSGLATLLPAAGIPAQMVVAVVALVSPRRDYGWSVEACFVSSYVEEQQASVTAWAAGRCSSGSLMTHKKLDRVQLESRTRACRFPAWPSQAGMPRVSERRRTSIRRGVGRICAPGMGHSGRPNASGSQAGGEDQGRPAAATYPR